MSVDDKVISASFETTKFVQGSSELLKALQKINESLANVGKDNGLDKIDKSASKVTFGGLSSAIDKIKGKFHFPEADQAFSDIEKGSGKVGFLGIGTAIDKLKGKFHFPEADDAFSQVEKSSGKVTFEGLGRAIDGIGNKFGVMEGAASVALGNLVTKVASASANLAKSFSVSPITDGLSEYETQLNAVQTILSNTAASGAKLKDVNKALNELNHYADLTIYNFTEMTKNIGTFTAAGVDLKTATQSIKGIANLAALSGSNSQQASTAMYQLSQAISSGRVSLQDWNSVVNAGMGGTVFQRALAQTAEQMGTIKKGALELKGPMKNVVIDGKSFRESITAKPGQESWLTSKVLTNTLKQLSGDMSDAQLKAEGFSDAQIKAIQAQAKMAVNAATQVKTLSGVVDTAKEAMGSGWAQTWQLIFGDFGEAKSLFTGMSNALNGMISDSANSRNALLKDWKDLGGRKVLIEGLKNVFVALGSVLKPIKEAFRDIFPAQTGKGLFELTEKFRDFTASLKIGPETADKLKHTFAGFFAVLDIGKQIVSGIFHVIGDLFGSLGHGSGGFLDLTAKIGDFFVSVDKGLKDGKGLNDFFDGISAVLQVPIRLLGVAAHAIAGLFGGFDTGKGKQVGDSLNGVKDAVSPLSGVLGGLTNVWHGFLDVLAKVGSALKPAVAAIGNAFSGLGKSIADGIHTGDFSAVLDVIKTGLLGGILLLIRKFVKGGAQINIGKGLFGNIADSFGALTGTLKAMQTNIKADTLLKIAAAVGLLSVAVVALSLIDSDGLKRSLTAMAVGFAQLLGAMAILTKIGGVTGFIKIPFIAASMILLAGAIDVLVIAVAGLSRLSWEDLLKGLTGVGALLTMISIAAGPLSANSAGLIRAGIGIGAIAIALNLLALAVTEFGHMDWKTIGKGLAGVAGSLVVIGAAANLFPTGMVAIGAGLVLVGAGLNILALAMKQFAGMSWGEIGKGLVTVAGALVIIAGAMRLMPPSMVLQSAGLVLVAVALNGIAAALKIMGSSSIEEIAKGLATLAGAMVILAVGLTAMSGSLAGSAALAIAAASLTLLVPALKVLGGMSWTEIAKGLIALAGAFVVLGVAGIALAPVAPALLALGGALVLIGGGFTLVGAGLTLISTAISALAIAGPLGIKLLVSAITQLGAAIPNLVTSFVKGLLTMVQKIAELAPQFVEALGEILANLATAVINAAPLIASAMGAVIQAALKTVRDNFPALVATGLGLLTALLTGIKNNIGKVVTTVADIIINLLGALTAKLPQVIAAGVGLLVALLNGISNNLSRVTTATAGVIAAVITAVGSGASRIVGAGVDMVVKLVSGLASKLPAVVGLGEQIIAKLIAGIGSAAGSLVSKAASIAGKFIASVASSMLKLVDTGAQAIVNFLNGIAGAIRTYEPQIIVAGANIGKAVAQGFIDGLGQVDILGPLKRKFSGAVKSVKDALGIHSPSTVFAEMGGFAMEGFANGIASNTGAFSAMSSIAYGIIDGMKSIFQIESPSKVMHDIGQFVGQGFAEGLMGSKDQIDGVFTDLNNKVSDAMTTLRTTIATENDNLKKLRDARKPDEDAIAKAKEALQANKTALEELIKAHTYLGSALTTEKTMMDGHLVSLKTLATMYEGVVKQLDDANTALATAKKTRDDAEQSFADQYAGLPEIVMVDKDGNPIDPATQIANWMQALQNQASAVSTYGDTLEQLRKLGLDDATYQKLLKDGTADQAFASQLLAGGKTAVDGLNTLDKELQRVSGRLGSNAATNLYQAGVDAAQGLVNGLNDSKSKISKAMEAIATAMIKAIKKKLHIKSPSREFAKVGKFSSQGLAKGLEDSSGAVMKAAENVGDQALAAMQKSMRDVSNALSSEIDANPTITPVLDLTQLQKDARQLTALNNVVPITAAASFGQASAIAASQPGTPGDDEDGVGGNGTVLQFVQNNHSPEALSETEIYRQTNNQLSLVKKALGL